MGEKGARGKKKKIKRGLGDRTWPGGKPSGATERTKMGTVTWGHCTRLKDTEVMCRGAWWTGESNITGVH